MPKIKVENPPEFVEGLAVNEPEVKPDQDLPTEEAGSTSDRPTGEESHKEPTESHLSPNRTEEGEGSAPERISFWELLALAGYEVWGE